VAFVIGHHRKDREMEIKVSVLIKADFDKIWHTAADQFTHVDRWASNVRESEGKTIQGYAQFDAPCNERTCQTSFGMAVERVVDWSKKEQHLAYEVTKGMPFFVKKGVNRWSFESVGANDVRFTMRMEMELLPIFSLLMGPLMKAKLKRVMTESAEEFKFFVENDKPHPRKVKAAA
jgi:hypothetical protein